MAQITVRLSDELLARVDEARDLVPRERWVRRVLEEALEPSAGTASRTALPTSPRTSGTVFDRQARLNRAKGL